MRLRLFAAIDCDPAMLRKITDFESSLKTSARHQSLRLRWADPDKFHITLRFFGSTDESLLPSLGSCLSRVAEQTAPFDLEAKGFGAFPSDFDAHVLWVGISCSPELEAIARSLEAKARKLGFPPENRPFAPHLTLARSERNARALLDVPAPESFGVSRVDRLVLFESKTLSSGSIYERRGEFRFQK